MNPLPAPEYTVAAAAAVVPPVRVTWTKAIGATSPAACQLSATLWSPAVAVALRVGGVAS